MLSNQLWDSVGTALGQCGDNVGSVPTSSDVAAMKPWLQRKSKHQALNFSFELWILRWIVNSICLKILAEVHVQMNSLHVLKESHESFVNILLGSKEKNQKMFFVHKRMISQSPTFHLLFAAEKTPNSFHPRAPISSTICPTSSPSPFCLGHLASLLSSVGLSVCVSMMQNQNQFIKWLFFFTDCLVLTEQNAFITKG